MGDVAYVEKITGLFGIAGPMGELNINTVICTWIVITLIIIGALIVKYRLAAVPGRVQVIAELYVGAFDSLVRDTLEFDTVEKNRKYLPLVGSLFVFLVLCNILGFIPCLTEPTGDLNTTFGLGLLGFIIATGSALLTKGAWGFFKDMYITIEGKGIGQWIMNFPFFLLNVVGEFGKVASISFRLFGNIKGGAIILLVVSWLAHYFILPLPLIMFFGFFVGTIQAFVFTMLTLTYIAVAIK